ncbi:MAG: TolC family protein [Gammaproteobacteria bacterium]|nr:TolC family protein [Gammaproteobacteria bacterium]
MKTTGMSLFTLTLTLLSGCMMVGPDYQQPKTQIADEWNIANHGVENSPTQDAQWWKTFNDPILDQLITIGYHNNLSLQSAGVRVLQARAQLAQSVGELYPQQQGISSSLTRQRIASGSEFADVIPSNLETSSMSFSASWEPDFWGKYRRAIAADNATFLSSIAAYDDALVSLTAEIGSAYVAIRLYEMQITLSEKKYSPSKTTYEHQKNSIYGWPNQLIGS